MDQRYLEAIDRAEAERLDELESEHRRALEEGELTWDRVLRDVLPRQVYAATTSGRSVAHASLDASAALVPFYDLQVAPLCAMCSTDRETAERLNAWLGPLMQNALAVPVLAAQVHDTYPPLLSTALSGPWIHYRALIYLERMFGESQRGFRSCAYCASDKCPLFREYLSIAASAGVAPHTQQMALVALGRRGEESLGEQLDCLKRLDADGQHEYLMLASSLGFDMQIMDQGAALGARSCISGHRLNRVLHDLGESAPAPLASLNDPLRTFRDVENHLSVAEHLGIAFDPACDPAKYVAAVAPHAGDLSGVFSGHANDRQDLGHLANAAAEINESVMRMARLDASLATVAAALDHPIIKTLILGSVLAGIDPWLAPCGAIGVVAEDVIRKANDRGLGQKLPGPLLRLLESAGAFPKGTYAVHDIRKRLTASGGSSR